MTTVLCCPVTLWDATRESLRKYAPDAVIVPVPVGDISRAWQEHVIRWGQDDLLVIDQDVILHEDVIPQFEACPEPWCLFPYRHDAQGGDFMDTGVGCNRFRREFQEKVPTAAIEAIPGCCSRCQGVNRKCFAHIDGRTREAGEAAGFRLHVHWPSVGHRDVAGGEYQ